MPPVSERDREMILNPLRWPLLVLPLVRKTETYGTDSDLAVFAPGLSVRVIKPDEPIEIRLCNMYGDLKDAPRKEYANVDALLADGWQVD